MRGVHNRELEIVDDDESGGEEQPKLVLLLIHSQTEEEVIKDKYLDFPSTHKPEEDRHTCPNV